MARRTTFETVRKIGLTLPEVEESTTGGITSLKMRGKLLAWPAINKSAEPGSLAMRIDFDQRDALIAEAPDIYYLTDHYVNFPVVLVRLSRIDSDQLRDLLQAGWKFVTAKLAASKKRTRKSKI